MMISSVPDNELYCLFREMKQVNTAEVEQRCQPVYYVNM